MLGGEDPAWFWKHRHNWVDPQPPPRQCLGSHCTAPVRAPCENWGQRFHQSRHGREIYLIYYIFKRALVTRRVN